MADLQFQREGKRCTVRGRSMHLVAGDPYVLTFAGGAYPRLVTARSPDGTTVCENNGDLARLILTPAANGRPRSGK